jgi:hypothetical protein
MNTCSCKYVIVKAHRPLVLRRHAMCISQFFFSISTLKTYTDDKILENQELQETQRSFNPSVLFVDDENIFEQQLKVFL